MSTAPALRKRRTTVGQSINRLVRRLGNLEGKEAEPNTLVIAQDIAAGLTTHDCEFKDFHYQLLDLIDEADQETLDKEQKKLDEHDDMMDDTNLRVKQLLATCSALTTTPKNKTLSRKQAQLEKTMISTCDAIKSLTAESDCHLIGQYNDRVQAFKAELKALADDLLQLDPEDSNDLISMQQRLDEVFFECELSIRKLIGKATPTASSINQQGIKLPKLLAPTFDGKLTSWTSFWQQFDVAIHSRSGL